MEKTYVRNCPQCNKELFYTFRSGLYAAKRNNSLCNSCGITKHNQLLSKLEFEKVCIDCGEIYIGKIRNLRCPSCFKKIDNERKNIVGQKCVSNTMNNLEVGFRDLNTFGKDFLLSNPMVLEVCQIREKISKEVNKNYYNNKNKLKI